VHTQLNEPYSAGHFHTAGTYRVNVGPVFYVGSTTCYGKRSATHKSDLASGIHRNAKLQAAYSERGTFEFVLLTVIPRKRHDTDADHEARLRLNEQWLIDASKDDPNFANTSESSTYNTTAANGLRAKWQDPAWRESQITRLKARKGDLITAETRSLLAKAKTGGCNPKSTPCKTTLAGVTKKFPTVKAAADFHGVRQQTMDLWMRGVVPWPGTGKRRPKAASAHLTGLTGELM
jgi:hypothetical protein